MALADFINTYTGTYVNYDGLSSDTGQCVQLVELYAAEVLGVALPLLVNAADYWTTIPGYDQIPVGQQQIGDIVVYRGHDAFPEGHIAIQCDGQVFEQNADPDGSPAHLYPRATTYLLGSLRLKGSNMNEQQAASLSLSLRIMQGKSVAEANAFATSDIPYIMASNDQAVKLALDIKNSPEWNALNADAVAHRNATQLKAGEYRV